MTKRDSSAADGCKARGRTAVWEKLRCRAWWCDCREIARRGM